MFGQAFMLEGERRKVRIRLVPLDTFTREGHGYSPVLHDILQGGGSALVGVLLAVTRELYPPLSFLENGLRAAGVPVVRLGKGEDGAVLAGSSRRSVMVSRIDERAAVSAALGHLHERGHRCIAFIPDLLGEWQAGRLRVMQNVAAELEPTVCLYTAPSQYEHLEEEVEEIARLRKDGPERVRRAIESFVQDDALHVKNWGHLLDDRLLNSPYAGYAAMSRAVRCGAFPRENVELRIRIMWGAVGLTALMYHPDVTAVVAANDKAARNYIMRSLAELGIRVPEDVSLLSFDNQFRETCAPPTTVDFGFFDLGYKSFHALVGDVPVSINRHNEIRAIPFIVDRDTVGWIR
jgi:DNA-binding LacI/PurR family transcriptional regulator